MRRSEAAALAAALCVGLSVSPVAQVRARPTEKGPWRPWSFTAVRAWLDR